MVKWLAIYVLLFPLLVSSSLGQEMAPYSLINYGHFKKMLHMKKTAGVVDLKQAISSPHLYGVGAPAHGTGEITILDGKLWLDYGADGLGNAKHQPAEGEQAVLLVTVEVSQWRDVTVPEDMSAAKLHDFILMQAGASGLDTEKPFPFMLEGQYFDLDWHVLNGLKSAQSGASAGGHKGVYNRIREHQAENAGKIIGFYSAASQGVYTHPGESWHKHLVIEKEGKAGHIDAVSVRAGSVLKLPISCAETTTC